MRKLSVIICALLVLALLLSSFSVLSVAKDKNTSKYTVDAIDSVIPEKQLAASSSDQLSGQTILDRLSKTDSSIKVFYNRHYSEGWDYDNGFSHKGNERENKFSLTHDYAADINLSSSSYKNYYMLFEQMNTQNGFLPMDVNAVLSNSSHKTYIEFDFKASDNATIPGILMLVANGVGLKYTTIFSLSQGYLTILGKNVGKIGSSWCHIALEIDYAYGKSQGTGSAIKYTAYIGSLNKSVSMIETVSSNIEDLMYLMQIRLGRCGSSFKSGASYGIDNMRVYTASGFANMPDNEVGVVVDTNKSKSFAISNESDFAPSVKDIAESALNMKVNSSFALIKGQKSVILVGNDGLGYGAPFKDGGTVMLPLTPILDYTGAEHRFNSNGYGCEIYLNGSYYNIAAYLDTAIGSNGKVKLSHPVMVKEYPGGNVLYASVDDVEKIFKGYYVTYDEVGFISIATVDDYLDRDLDEEFMREIMKRFIFDSIDPTDVYSTVKEYTNNFDHPYMYANQDRFDYLRDVYNSEEGDSVFDADLYKYLTESVDYAIKYYEKYANVDDEGKYVGIKDGHWVYNSQGFASWSTVDDPSNHSVAIAPYPDTNGYDPAGGRLNVLSDGENALTMACEAVGYAYQITRNTDYAKFVYDWSVALTSWTHWAPGHYLNVAIASRNVAIGYDFLYDAWVDLGLDPGVVRDGLHRLCTYTAWRSLNNLSVEYTQPSGSVSREYWRHTGNWNPVCSSGVLPSALISLENSSYIDQASFVYAKTIHYLGQNGFNYFAFDGSYRESAGYWSATIRFSQYCILTVQNSIGTDLGLSTAPGLDITNYFGSHLESSDYESWNYHDDWIINMPSYWFYMAAEMFNMPEYAALRYYHLQNGKPTHRWDALFYDKSMIEKGQVDLPLDFVMDSIDASVSRDSWDKGALYVGVMGGINNVAHGQYDSGNWIYENFGVRWFCDLGADDYNLYGGGLNSGYYRYSSEGNNTIAITSQPVLMPHGQVVSKGGEITSAIVNEYGSATVIDQSEVYGGKNIITYARRGMLLTNDRKTVVIQDEIKFKNTESLAWFAHYDTNLVNSVKVSSSGKEAFMYAGYGVSQKVIRVTLLSDNASLRFEIMDTYNTVLDATPEWGYSFSKNGIAEQNRDKYMRLVIKADNVSDFNVAVVIEEYDDDKSTELGYKELLPMQSWVPAEDTRVVPEIQKPEEGPKAPSFSSLILNANVIEDYIARGTYLSADREDFYRAMAEIEYALPFYASSTSSEMIRIRETHDTAKRLYDPYVTSVNQVCEKTEKLSLSLLGIK